MNCWTILKIEPTNDIKVIKHAYAALTKECHPEEDPEGFKIIQEAYKQASAYAKGKKHSPIFFVSETGNDNINLKNVRSFKQDSDLKTDVEVKEETETPDPEKEHYKNLFQTNQEEWNRKVKENGEIYRQKVSWFFREPHKYNVYGWRKLMREEGFFFAVYDADFIDFLFRGIMQVPIGKTVLFEIYFYFLKYKKREFWDGQDYPFYNCLRSKIAGK